MLFVCFVDLRFPLPVVRQILQPLLVASWIVDYSQPLNLNRFWQLEQLGFGGGC